jgi:hypothetical protein
LILCQKTVPLRVERCRQDNSQGQHTLIKR